MSTSRSPFVLILAAALLVVGLPVAAAQPAPPAPPPPAPLTQDGVEGLPRPARPGAAAPASSDIGEPTLFPGAAEDGVLITDEERSPVGPGMTLTTFDRLDPRGWLRGHVLEVDLAAPGTGVDLLANEHVAQVGPVSGMVERAGAVAGVNGDFFDINNTGAALGGEVTGGALRKSPVPGWHQAAAVGPDGLGRLVELFLDGTVTLPDGDHGLAGLNQHALPTGAIGAYTPVWGPATRAGAVANATGVTEVVIAAGEVTAVHNAVTTTPIPEDGFVLVGREDGAAVLAGLEPGDDVAVEYAPATTDGEPVAAAVSGNTVLVRDGEPTPQDDTAAAPRTAVGFADGGRRMVLVVVDGRQVDSRGTTLAETADLLDDLGAEHALNLDGGGSSTMVARVPGEAPAVRNSPSDGFERPVPNGLGVFAAPGSGDLAGLEVAGAVDTHHPERVFPGLSRSFRALGYDETYAPVETATALWRADPRRIAQVDDAGVVRARRPGTGTVQARQDGVTGTHELRILGPLVRVEPSTERLALDGPGDVGRFSVTGLDADGYDALVEPRDVALTYDQAQLRITPAEDGSYTVEALAADVGAAVEITVQGISGYLPVSVGLDTVMVSEFEDPSEWRFSSARGTGSLSAAPGRTGNGLKVSYDFTRSTSTRTANAGRSPRLPLPGEPSAIGMWVNAGGRGEWSAFTIRDADGRTHFLYGDYYTWTGWQYTEVAVPAGVTYPIELSTIGAIEIRAGQQYMGELVYDDLVVKVPPSVDVPDVPEPPDPMVVTQGDVDEQRWEFAVLADSQFVAANPDSDDARIARRALQQIAASDAEFLIVGGDLVDTDAPENFDFGRQMLAEEIGDRMPVYYIPGNHEVLGTGRIDNFVAAFGETRFTFDHRDTRFILLNSAFGTLRGSEFAQIAELKAALDSAAADPEIEHVVVFPHHPTVDPNPQAASQLADRKEVALIEEWLTAFEEESGKDAAFLSGHAHTTDVRRADGVPYLVVPPAGAKIYGAQDDGGFSAWSLFGIAERDRPGQEWLEVAFLPLAEEVAITAPPSVAAGSTVTVTGEGRLTQGRVFPLRYPATVEWSGDGVQVVEDGRPQPTRGRPLALYDPATGELRGLRAGTVELTVRANDRTATATIAVTPRER